MTVSELIERLQDSKHPEAKAYVLNTEQMRVEVDCAEVLDDGSVTIAV